MAADCQTTVYLFGAYQLDLGLHELRRDGQACALEPQAFDLLVYLIENRGRLVDRDELNQHIWGGRIVSDSSLSTCVKTARQAIGDNGKTQHFIRTFPRRGYRFVGQIEERNQLIPLTLMEAGPAPTKPGPWQIVAAAGVVFAAAVGGAFGWSLAQTQPPATITVSESASQEPSIAVLPFVNLGPDPDQSYFVDSMAEDIITDLSRLSGLQVMSRKVSFSHREQQLDPRAIARKLNVRYLVEGSVYRLDDQVRVNAQLIDTVNGGRIWAQRFDGDITNMFELQDGISEGVVEAFKVLLTPTQRTRINRTPTNSAAAYELYLKATEAARGQIPEQLIGAMALYQRATELDPSFAEAYVGDAEAASIIWRQGRVELMPQAAALSRAKNSASRALALDPNNADTHMVLALIKMALAQYPEALRLAENAVNMDPNSLENLLKFSYLLIAAGQHQTAEDALERVLQFEPQLPPRLLYLLGTNWFHLRHYERAVTALTAARDGVHGPSYPWLSVPLAASYAYLDQWENADNEILRAYDQQYGLNLNFIRNQFHYFRRREDISHLVDGLRRAGVPEWPFGFTGETENQLTGAELRRLFSNIRLVGQNRLGYTFEEEYSENGTWVYRSSRFTISGQSSVEGNLRCGWTKDLRKGRKFCGPVYRNPEGMPEERNEFIAPNLHFVATFSVLP